MIENVLSFLNDSRGVFEFVIAAAAVWFLTRKAATAAVGELEDKIISTVQEATEQIQVDANGGQSLSDVAKGLKSFRDYQTQVNADVKQSLETIKQQLETDG